MALCKIGSYCGVCEANVNLVNNFQETEKSKCENIHIPYLRQVAIEAPSGTKFKINDTNITMPTTGIFEVGFGLLDITNITFNTAEDVNIVYMY